MRTKIIEKEIRRELKNNLGREYTEKLSFRKCVPGSPEGYYIFFEKGYYHLVFTEKGVAKEIIKTKKKREILWHALNAVSFGEIMDYAISNSKEGEDFRRAMFDMEIEIFSRFGEDFRERKIAEVDEIVKNNPFVDKVNGEDN